VILLVDVDRNTWNDFYLFLPPRARILAFDFSWILDVSKRPAVFLRLP